MPPRFSYWTILAGGLPTSFRAAERDDLLPTLRRLQNPQNPADATGDPAECIGIHGSRLRSKSASATRLVANSGSIASRADPSRNRQNARDTNQSDRELIDHGPINHAPIDRAPFYALRLYPADLGTAVGLRTDADARVLNKDGVPIDGLYAIGASTGGLEGGNGGGYVGGLIKGVAFGLRAAEHIAQALGKQPIA